MNAPMVSVAHVQRVAAAELSPPSRVRHVLLLLVSSTMAVGVGSLWATEPALPRHTQIALAVMVGIAIGWSIFAIWVLARRRVLFGSDRVVAARLGLVFSAIGTAGMLVTGYWAGIGAPAYVAALLEGVLCVVAFALLARAKRRVRVLTRRRRELEAQMSGRN